MNAAKIAFARSKKFVADHKVAIAVVSTTVATVIVMEKLRGGALRELHEFLGEKELENEFTQFLFEKSGL